MEESISRKKFIRLGAAIGVSVAGATVVAGCGGGGGSGSGGSETSSGGGAASTGGSGSGTTEMGSSGGQAIAKVSDVPQNSAKKFTNSGEQAVLVHLKSGDFVAYSAVCTHQGCIVDYQKQSSQLACPCHGSLFDPSRNAQAVNGPAQRPLPKIPIKVEGGQITKA